MTIPVCRAKTAYGVLSFVRKLILAEPLRYDQTCFLDRRADGYPTHDRFPACGTIGCVAGWVATVKYKAPFNPGHAGDIARRILGLSYGQAEDLFDGSAVSDVGQSVRHAKRGAAHIAAFQRKYRQRLLKKKVT